MKDRRQFTLRAMLVFTTACALQAWAALAGFYPFCLVLTLQLVVVFSWKRSPWISVPLGGVVGVLSFVVPYAAVWLIHGSNTLRAIHSASGPRPAADIIKGAEMVALMGIVLGAEFCASLWAFGRLRSYWVALVRRS